MTRFAQKGFFCSKTEKVHTTYFIHNSVYLFAQKSYFQSKAEKSEHHHGILHIWISLGTKSKLKLIISSFWTKFTQKRYFKLKREQAVQGLQAFAFRVVNVNSTVVFKHFEDLKYLIILNILKEKLIMSFLLGSFYLKIV